MSYDNVNALDSMNMIKRGFRCHVLITFVILNEDLFTEGSMMKVLGFHLGASIKWPLGKKEVPPQTFRASIMRLQGAGSNVWLHKA